jgi:hypothetical protein
VSTESGRREILAVDVGGSHVKVLRSSGDERRRFESGPFEDYVGERGRERLGKKKWQKAVAETIELLAAATEPDYVVLGGGNAKRVDELPPNARLGANQNAFLGGFRLWDPSISTPPTG